jgi:hypothetical protein
LALRTVLAIVAGYSANALLVALEEQLLSKSMPKQAFFTWQTRPVSCCVVLSARIFVAQ